MNIWEFLDKQAERMRVEHIAGAGIFILTGVILWLAASNQALREDELFRVLAQAIVVQGLVGLAMAAWFTTKHRTTEKVEISQPDDEPIPVVETPAHQPATDAPTEEEEDAPWNRMK